MADTSPRRPYPGQQWSHGWIPKTAAAKASKGKAGNPDAIKARLAEARASALSKATPSGGASWAKGKTAPGSSPKSPSSPSKAAPAKAAPKAPAKASAKPASSPTSAALDDAKAAIKAGQNGKAVNALTKAMKTATKDEKKAISKLRSDFAAKVMGKDKAAPKAPAGKKVGEDSRGNPLKTGDDVKITAGPNAGKTGKVAGKGKSGAVLVDTGEGDPVSMSPANLSTPGATTKQQAPKAPAKTQAKAEAPKPTAKPANQSGTESGSSAKGPYGFDSSAPKAQQVEQAQRIIREMYDDLADEQMAGWLPMVELRRELAGMPRDVQDDALKKLMLQPDMRLVPESVRTNMSREERNAALYPLGDPDDPIDMLMVTNPDGSRRESVPDRERLKANRERAPQEAQKSADAKSSPVKTYDFDSSAPRPKQVDRAAEIIGEAYDDLNDRKGRTGWLPIIELRKSLSGIPRDVQDDALKKLMADSNFNTNNRPMGGNEAGPGYKTEDLDKAALDVFGEPIHEIMIADPLSGRARRKVK